MARDIPPELSRKMEAKFRRMRALARRGAFTGKEVVLFGVTLDAHWLVDMLRELGVTNIAFVDNAAHKQGGVFQGVPIRAPKELLSRRGDVVVLLPSDIYAVEMGQQLRAMGYVEGTDYAEIDPPRKLAGRLARTRGRFHELERLRRGYRFYRELARQYGRDRHVILCPYPGSGDSYLIGRHLDAYLKANGITEYVLVANGRLVGKVLDLFGFQVDEVVDEETTQSLMTFYQFLGADFDTLHIMLFWGWRTRATLNTRFNDAVPSFEDVFKLDVMQLPPEAPVAQPRFEQPPGGVEAFFAEHDLPMGRTVILAPYMGTIWNLQLPQEFWERFARELMRRGYTVCTNSIGPREPVVAGTRPIFFPLNQTVPIIDAAGHFAAIRSGFCDVASTSSANMVVLYVAGHSAVSKHFFGLQEMGLNTTAHEVEFHDDVDDLLRQSLERFPVLELAPVDGARV